MVETSSDDKSGDDGSGKVDLYGASYGHFATDLYRDIRAASYGVDIGAIREIIRMQDITQVPGTPAFVEGVVNLRGKVNPVVDLRKRFGLPVGERSADNRIVVVDIGGQDIGMIVDAVTEVMRISTDAVGPPSSVITTE